MSHNKKKTFTYYTPPTDAEPLPLCAYPGCAEVGKHKALMHPDDAKNFKLLCAAHIQLHNQSANYYAGMSCEEIEHHLRQDATWRRPRWSLRDLRWPHQQDQAAEALQNIRQRGYASDRSFQPNLAPPQIRKALEQFNLPYPFSSKDLKKSYKNLVKKYHPDLNKNCKVAEEKFKSTLKAYALLKTYIIF